MKDGDAFLAGFVTGVVAVVIVVPGMFVAGVRYVPPFRRAVHARIALLVDEQVAGVLRDVPTDVIGLVDAALRVQMRQNLGTFLHAQVGTRAADAAIRAMGAPLP